MKGHSVAQIEINLPPYPFDDGEHAPIPVGIEFAEVVRADQVAKGDMVIGNVWEDGTTGYNNDQYIANPQPYDENCGCATCWNANFGRIPVVNLSQVNHWEACDVVHTHYLMIIIRAVHLPSNV